MVHMFVGDERDVPHDHVESNYGMIQRTMLDFLPIPLSNVHPMRADAPDIAAASAEYEQTIRGIVPADGGGLPRFDAVLLGMGSDGHVASLFPQSELLGEKSRLVASCVMPVINRRRMTITLPIINAARNVVLLVTGADKAPAVAKVVSDDASARATVPAGAINPHDGCSRRPRRGPAPNLRPQQAGVAVGRVVGAGS
jgi:6-phosphogluconolactonase